MSVLDRVRQAEKKRENPELTDTGESQSSTLVPRDSETILRLRGIIRELSNFQTANGDERFSRMGTLLGIVADELFEEIRDYDELVFRRYLVQVARITEWIATGDLSIIPEDLRPFLARIMGEVYIPTPAEELEPAQT